MKALAFVLFAISLLTAVGIAGIATARLIEDGRLTPEQRRMARDIEQLEDSGRRAAARNVLDRLRRADLAEYLTANAFLLAVQVAYVAALWRYFRAPREERLKNILSMAVVPCVSPGVVLGVPLAMGGLWWLERKRRAVQAGSRRAP
jgi:hypothetical protein